MVQFPSFHLRSLLARPLVDQLASNSTAAGSMTATAGNRFIEALIKSIGEHTQPPLLAANVLNGGCHIWGCTTVWPLLSSPHTAAELCLWVVALSAPVSHTGVIGASEIGDKTFFIAAVMAMRNSRWTVRPNQAAHTQKALAGQTCQHQSTHGGIQM